MQWAKPVEGGQNTLVDLHEWNLRISYVVNTAVGFLQGSLELPCVQIPCVGYAFYTDFDASQPLGFVRWFTCSLFVQP